MANPLFVSINRASKDNLDLQRLFWQHLGTKDHPRGNILSTYRTYRRSIKTAVKQGRQQALNELHRMKADVTRDINAAIATSIALGGESARVQSFAYKSEGVPFNTSNSVPNNALFAKGALATLEQQVGAVGTLLQTGARIEEITGDGTRLGLLQPAPIQNQTANDMSIGMIGGWWFWLFGGYDTGVGLPFRRQAVAGIDERTTTCCLMVHGQIVDMNQPFHLTGTPRYADRQQDPPFHNRCRTSVALYLPAFDDGFTKAMREAAQLEARLRGAAGYTPPRTANAFTRVKIK